MNYKVDIILRKTVNVEADSIRQALFKASVTHPNFVATQVKGEDGSQSTVDYCECCGRSLLENDESVCFLTNMGESLITFCPDCAPNEPMEEVTNA